MQATVFPSGIGEGLQFSAESATMGVDLANKDPCILKCKVFQVGDNVPANGPAYTPASSVISSYATSLDWIDLGEYANQNLDSQINKAAADLNREGQRYPIYEEAHDLLACTDAKYSDLVTQKYGSDYKGDQNKRFGNDDYLTLTNLSRLMALTSGRPEVMIGLIERPVDISRPDFSGSNIIGVGRYEPRYRHKLSRWRTI